MKPGAPIAARLLVGDFGETIAVDARETGVRGLLACTTEYDPTIWRIFHQRSGAIVWLSPDPEQAIACAHALSDIDWTVSGETLRENPMVWRAVGSLADRMRLSGVGLRPALSLPDIPVAE